MTGETVHSGDGPVAMHTSLGWVLSGPVPCIDSVPTSTKLKVNVSSDKDNTRSLDHQLKAFWDLESLGIIDQDHTIYDQFHNFVGFKDGHYEVMLPWKDPLFPSLTCLVTTN